MRIHFINRIDDLNYKVNVFVFVFVRNGFVLLLNVCVNCAWSQIFSNVKRNTEKLQKLIAINRLKKFTTKNQFKNHPSNVPYLSNCKPCKMPVVNFWVFQSEIFMIYQSNKCVFVLFICLFLSRRNLPKRVSSSLSVIFTPWPVPFGDLMKRL